ncbi:MAG: aminomethyl transferase family protein, partial [Acidimicrobiia bacterium]
EARSDSPHRQKVTFQWSPDDVGRVWQSYFNPPGENFKVIDLPNCNYTSATYDRIEKDGKTVGFSMFGGYSFNERSVLSLGVVDPDIEIGDELTLVWGEEGGGTAKPTVEPHVQTEIQVQVVPTPFSRDARETYAAASWRSKAL